MIKVKVLTDKICILYYKNNLLYSTITGDTLEGILNTLEISITDYKSRVVEIDGYLEKGFYKQGIRVLKEFKDDIENSNIFLKTE